MEQKLFDTIISDIKNDSFFTEYKYKKSENMLYHREGNSTLFVELDHWQDYAECIIYIIYGRRFDILTKWFEKFSFKSLRDQRNNPDVMCDNTYFGQEEYIYFDYRFSDYKVKMGKMLPMIKENLTSFARKYSTMEDYYKEDVLPIITNERELPDVGADWIFIYLTLGYLVDRENYNILKKIILERVEWMHSRGEPNIEHYYSKMEEIITYMEKNVKLQSFTNFVDYVIYQDFPKRFIAFRLPQKKSTDHTEDTEKDFRRMIKTTPSDFKPQTSDFIFALQALQYNNITVS